METINYINGDDLRESVPLVSVCVVTFNHRRYIERCLDGILSQRTPFAIEILIHDDASTDGTDQILREYEKRYPSIFRVFYEEENQYEKDTYKGGYRRGLLEPASKGKYIAFTEGDDYWCDPDKLAKQVKYLEEHDDVVLACHSALIVDCSSGACLGSLSMGSIDKDLLPSDIIRNWAVPTASWVYRRGSMAAFDDDWAFDMPVGDFPTVLYASTVGRVRYFNEQMSVYRYQVPGSWTAGLKSESFVLDNARRWLSMFNNIDRVTSGQFHADFVFATKPRLRALLGGSEVVPVTTLIREARAELTLWDWGKIWLKRFFGLIGFRIVRQGRLRIVIQQTKLKAHR